MPDMLSAGVYPVEVDFSAYVKTVGTSTFGLVGVFQKGPVDAPILITSFEQAKSVLGDYVSGHFGLFALKNFFDNGGARAYVVRATKHTAGVSTALAATATLVDRAGSPVNTLTVNGSTPGAWANGLQVTITDSVAAPTTAFTLTVKDAQNNVLETFKDLLIGAANQGSSDYVTQRVNGVSAYITVQDLASATASPNNRPANGTFPLASGDDGLTGIATTDFIGSAGTTVGLYALDSVAVNFVAIPGEGANDAAAATIGNALITYVEGRKDCVAILEAPLGKTAQQLADFRMGPNSGAAFNSAKAAIYGPWLDTVHPTTGAAITLPPSGFVAGVFARNDTVGAVWTAPAGLNRGQVLGVNAPHQRFTKGDRDVLYEVGVNPIAIVAGVLSVYGQKTLQLKASAKDRLNVSRLECFLESSISDSGQFFVFEANNVTTWQAFKRTVNPFLQRIKDAGGFYDFLLICDEKLNTPALIDANTMKARLLYQPTKTAEFLPIEFAIAGSGDSLASL